MFKEAFRVTKSDGWLQSCEVDVNFYSDDGTADTESALKMWGRLYSEGGAKTGLTFDVVKDGLQKPAMEAAGFVDVQVADYKLPVGGWAQDEKLAEVGKFVKLTMENDVEGE